MAHPGTPVQELFPIRRPPNGPPGLRARQVMSPTHNLLPVLRTSFAFVNQRIDMQRGAEEASAQRVTFEANMVFEATQREETLRRELQEIRFAEACSLQAQQELHFWEQHERAAYEARLRTAELRLCQETAQHTHNLEVNALQAHHQLRGELEEAETSYRHSLQTEAEAFAHHLRQELEYQTTSNAQAQSLLSAERRQRDIDLDDQAERWQEAVDMITTGAQEELNHEIQECTMEEMTNQELRQELEEAQNDLTAWDDWYNDNHLPFLEAQESEASFAQTNELMAGFNKPESSEQTAAKKALPQPAPLTPAVLQSSALSSRHLPPTSLPFSSRKVSEKTAQQEQEERLAEANFAQQEWQSHRDAELQEAHLKIRLLEEQQASGTVPTLPTTQQYSHGGQTTGLTIGQPNPVLPSSGQRGPWASTRERFQQPIPTQPTPLLAGASTGVPSVAPVSGVASTHGAALPAMMVPNPSTPLGAFPTQTPLPAHPQLPADEYFKREKSPLPKLVIKGGDATSVTRTIHEWLQKTAMALNTWSSSAIQLWHHAVGLAKGAHLQWTLMAPSQRALQTGLPSTGNSLPPQLSVLEATMRADLINQCLPERVQSLAIQKSATTVADLLFLTFQTFLPSEPSARVDGLADIEAPVRPSRTFAEALSFLRSWRQKIITVVSDLGGNPEPLKLFGSLRSLISSLVAGDTSFATEISQIYRQTNVKILCTDDNFLRTLDMVEIELAARAHEDEEEKRKQKNANVAIASFAKGGGPKPKPICRDFLTDNGCNKGGQCTYQHPQTVGRCLRCGSTKHQVSECKRPRKDAPSQASPKGKGRGKGPPLPKDKPGAKGGGKTGGATGSTTGGQSQGQPKGKPQAKKRSQSQPKSKAKAKPSAHQAEAGFASLSWAEDDDCDPPTSSTADAPVPFAGCVSLDNFAHACSFYTTFNPAFHSSEPVDDQGFLPPILDTGATHCLLPLRWLSPEQAAHAKRIHLKVASGTSVRALLFNNIIYCKTVSRPLLSVGQLKSMLDVRFLWDDSSPCLLACSGGLRYVLLTASVIHHLPVVSHDDMHVLLAAINLFTETGQLWDARTWSQKLGRKLSLYHWSTPVTTLPPDHAEFTNDPQVNFSSCQFVGADLCPPSSSTVIIEELVEEEGKKDSSLNCEGRKPTNSHDPVSVETLPALPTTLQHSEHAASTSFVLDRLSPALPDLTSSNSQGSAFTTLPFALDLDELDNLASDIRVVMDHSLPKSRTRTNVITEEYIPRGRLFGGYTTRGVGITHATLRFPEVVRSIFAIASSRPKDFAQEPFLSAQLNAATSLPVHKDKNNHSRSWLIAFGDFTGGRLWVESPLGTDPPPNPICAWQKKLRGEFVDVKNRWVAFDPQNYHAVEEVKSGSRRSIALFSPKNWKKLPSHCLDELIDIGFYPPLSAQSAEASATAADADATALPVAAVPLPSLSSLAVHSQASGLLPDSRSDLAQAMTLSMPTAEEQQEIEDWCRDETVSLPFSDLPCSDGSILPLSPVELEELSEHVHSGHATKSNLCRGCLEAEGPRKIHRSIREIDRATHTLHIDIAGPLVTSDDGFAYFLVGALRMPGFPLLIDVRLLSTRTSTEVCDELEKMVAFFESLQSEGFAIGETCRVKRLHSDRAGEFTAPYFARFLANHKTIHHSFTSGYDPQSNGTAERSVGLIKSLAARCLKFASLEPTYWSYAVRYAAQSLICRALQIRQRSLPFGSSVVALALGHQDIKFPQPRSITGRLLFWNHLHDQVSHILCPPEDDVSDPLVYRASLPTRLPPATDVDTLLDLQPLPSKKTFSQPLASNDDLDAKPKDLDPKPSVTFDLDKDDEEHEDDKDDDVLVELSTFKRRLCHLIAPSLSCTCPLKMHHLKPMNLMS